MRKEVVVILCLVLLGAFVISFNMTGNAISNDFKITRAIPSRILINSVENVELRVDGNAKGAGFLLVEEVPESFEIVSGSVSPEPILVEDNTIVWEGEETEDVYGYQITSIQEGEGSFEGQFGLESFWGEERRNVDGRENVLISSCMPSTEICDNADNDCDDEIDEDACLSPVSHWNFENKDVSDSVGYNDGAIAGKILFAESKPGNNIAYFKARNPGVMSVTSSSINYQKISGSLWVYVPKNDKGVKSIIEKSADSKYPGKSTWGLLKFKNDLYFAIHNTEYAVAKNFFTSRGGIYHIVFSYDPTNDKFEFYRNGVLVAGVDSRLESNLDYTNDPLLFGSWEVNNKFKYTLNKWWIDEIRLYEDILTKEQVEMIYDEERNKF